MSSQNKKLLEVGQYVIRPGSRISEKNGEIICARATELHVETGGVTPYVMYEDGKDRNSPLHPLFTWDNVVCGERYRLLEAAHMLRSVMLVVKTETDSGDPQLVRGFQPLMTREGRRYFPMAEIARSDMHSNLILAQFHRDALIFIKRYDNLKEAIPLIRAMRQWLSDH